ncbi:hypothetical protein ACM66B_006030 [Microbotryomycetes sp. NB124-2]
MKGDEDKQKTIGKHLVLTCQSLDDHLSCPLALCMTLSRCKLGTDAAIASFAPLSSTNADSGEPGDTIQFSEYIERNLRLYQIRHHIPLRPSSAASWTRNQLASSLRSRKPYSVNLLLGGYDPTASKPELYWIDYLGTMATVPYAAHGYGAYFCLSTMDRWHNPDMSLDEALDLLRKCVNELETRFIVNLGNFTVRVADKDGVRQVDLKTGETVQPQKA